MISKFLRIFETVLLTLGKALALERVHLMRNHILWNYSSFCCVVDRVLNEFAVVSISFLRYVVFVLFAE